MTKKRRQMQKRRTPKPPRFPKIQETPLTPGLARLRAAGKVEANAKAFMMGDVSIIIGADARTGLHISIAHPNRYPTWDEVVHIRYTLLPDNVYMAMMLPPQAEYVNVHENCFHLYQVFPQRQQQVKRGQQRRPSGLVLPGQ